MCPLCSQPLPVSRGSEKKELMPLICDVCKLNFCLTHRHPSDHDCQGPPDNRGWEAAAASASATTQASSSSSGQSKISEFFSGPFRQQPPAETEFWPEDLRSLDPIDSLDPQESAVAMEDVRAIEDEKEKDDIKDSQKREDQRIKSEKWREKHKTEMDQEKMRIRQLERENIRLKREKEELEEENDQLKRGISDLESRKNQN